MILNYCINFNWLNWQPKIWWC